MINDLETLFLPFSRGLVDLSLAQKTLFLNARSHKFLEAFPHLQAQQFFKPYAVDLEAAGFNTAPHISDADDAYDAALVLFPKNIIEGRGLIAQGLLRLKEGGIFICAADNKAGGTRLAKICAEFGMQHILEDSKNKARVVWGVATGLDEDALQKAVYDAREQTITGGEFSSVPGIFGWDKLDQGSQILLQSLPGEISGRGADFGCGYGYLSAYILGRYAAVVHMTCIDADYRAVEMCKKNLAAHAQKTAFSWADLTSSSTPLSNLDFIVMNPPFHEGKGSDSGIGAAFIRGAAASLKKRGILYMVANRHLPYEEGLGMYFTDVKKVRETNGFKVFAAVK